MINLNWPDHINKLKVETLRNDHWLGPCYACNKPDQPYRHSLDGNFCLECGTKKTLQDEIFDLLSKVDDLDKRILKLNALKVEYPQLAGTIDSILELGLA